MTNEKNKTNQMKCEKCDYEWTSRKEQPKACPRCKTRLDWLDHNNLMEEIENENIN